MQRRIHLIRGQKVMLDADLAELYHVPTKRLNEQVKRNRRRFPKDFMFRLTAGEVSALRSQFATSNEKRGGRRFLPYVFTQEGVAMLSSVLGSDRAIQVNIAIMRAFVRIRELATGHREILQRIDRLERKYEHHDSELANVFAHIRRLMPATPVAPKRRIGFSWRVKSKTTNNERAF